MSGILGILHLDGAPVERQLLEGLAEFHKFRGPDAQQAWTQGNVGFAHALLRTSEDCADERQPFQLGDNIWITADARVDGQRELVSKLTDAGQKPRAEACDAELVLRSYRAWGAECVDHLLGDFAFAIWDAPNQRLFCARDQMGVKPFYYAQVGPVLIFSNTLDCIRQHPAVSNRLNNLAIADFLLFDINQDPATTAFADIRRLPAAHALQCERRTVSIRRYWTLSVTEPIHFKHDSEYIERFRELLDQAVADRLRAKSAGILMSGGLDSTTVAAAAKRILTANGGLSAHTVVLSHDDERRYASLAASALQIPIQFRFADDCQLFDQATDPGHWLPFPEHSAWPDQTPGLLRQIGFRSRIALTGIGGDPCLLGRITMHFRELMRNRRLGPALRDATGYLTAEGRFSRLYVRARLKLLLNSENPFDSYPCWFNPDLEEECRLRDHWASHVVQNRRTAIRNETGVGAFRPEAVISTTHVTWQHYFESVDPGATKVPVQVRHPLFDVRVAKFLLRLPRLPWCCDKELLRRSARGILPDIVRLRRKSPVPDDPLVALLQKRESQWVDRFEPSPEFRRYVCPERIPRVWGEKRSGFIYVNLKPLSLNFWLRGK